ncbi:MAG: ABC transporter permease [Gemmatimonas sp.]
MPKLSFDVIAQDLRFGMRSARRAPLFSLLTVVTLAFGIGANTAVFSVVKSVLLDGLPYAGASQLVRVYSVHKDAKLGVTPFSPGAADDIKARAHSFSNVAFFRLSTLEKTLVDSNSARVITAATVSGEFFATFGVKPLVGRTLVASDEDAPAANAVAVLSYDAWKRIYSGDPNILKRTIRLDGVPMHVVGVLPPKFVGPMGRADVYVTLDIAVFRRDPRGIRNFRLLNLVGRLAPGATQQSADTELRKIAADMSREYPQTDADFTVKSLSLTDDMMGDTRKPLLIIMASAALVLLIACANLAGALLSRTLTRRKEFAVRLAIGAGTSRVVRQLLTESTMLSAAGGICGVAVAAIGVAAMRSLATTALPSYVTISLDATVILFAFALAVATGIVFGLAPAFSVSRTATGMVLQESSRAATEDRSSRRLRGMLVAGQIALSISLMVGAGLLARSFWAVTNISLGYEPRQVIVTQVKLPVQSYRTPDLRRVFYEQFFERLRALPGVTAVAGTDRLPQATKFTIPFSIDGVVWPAGAQPFATVSAITPDYFRALRIALRAGRMFTPADRPTPPILATAPVAANANGRPLPPLVATTPPPLPLPTPAIISEGMARTFWPASSALGQRIRVGPGQLTPFYEIIGVVADVRNDPTIASAEPTIFIPLPASSSTQVVIRTGRDPIALYPAIRRELAALNSAIPTDRISSLERVVDNGLARRRLPVVLMSAFGVLALLLASVGVYAMFAAMGAAREREFGVRVALGSSRRALVQLIVRQAAAWITLGLAGGALGVLAVTRLLNGMLNGISRFDPVTVIAAVLVLIVCGAVALIVPVRRAIGVDPVRVLR